MTRTVERIIDLAAMLMLLCFCYLFRESQPALAGLVVGAAIQFWMQKKNLAAQAVAAAKAAAEVLRTAVTVAEAKSAPSRQGEAGQD